MPDLVGVIVNRTARTVDKMFHYRAPDGMWEQLCIGCVVCVPFGVKNTPVEGYVVDFPETSPTASVKDIIRIVEPAPLFDEWQLRLCGWMRERYFATWLDCLKTMTPPAKGLEPVSDKTVRVASLAVPDEDAFDLLEAIRKRAPAQARVIELLLQNEFAATQDITHMAQCSPATLRSLEDKEIIEIREIEVFRNPVDLEQVPPTLPPEPTPEQAEAIGQLNAAVEAGEYRTFLLHGITGSGKTEVFLRAIRRAVDLGKTALVLVPEISLTPQMIERFAGRFGKRIAILHSRLSMGERYDQWKLIRNGEVDVVIGARSAIFAPIRNLGVVIIDEEHETTYKSEKSPRYHTREVAHWLCREFGAALVLASATPSVESYYHAVQGDYTLLALSERATKAALPDVRIVDMRQELEEGNRSVLSMALQQEIRKNLDAGQQTILFMNRRGYSTFVSCRSCGFVAKCDNCNISLTYHKHKNYLTCHYCGYTIRTYQTCPQCGSRYIKHFGSGTQRVEEEVRELFPNARPLRMDVDTTARKTSHEQILSAFRKGEADILIGTQMVAKGLDFPNVTLVGVVAADMSLNVDDYRANERTFGLITQVCGRAGRGGLPGRAVVQTYDPENPTLLLSKQQDYPAFYREDISLRKTLVYPPYCDMISLLFTGQNQGQVQAYARKCAQSLQSKLKRAMQLQKCYAILGPCPCSIERINNKYRYRLLMKCSATEVINRLLGELLEEHCRRKEQKWISLVIDRNPNNMM